VDLNADQGENTVVGGNTINSALRPKCCGGNSLTLLRSRSRCAIIVLLLRVVTNLATFLRLLYPLTPFSMLKSYFATFVSRCSAIIDLYIAALNRGISGIDAEVFIVQTKPDKRECTGNGKKSPLSGFSLVRFSGC
jgi:hypothetical protein